MDCQLDVRDLLRTYKKINIEKATDSTKYIVEKYGEHTMSNWCEEKLKEI